MPCSRASVLSVLLLAGRAWATNMGLCPPGEEWEWDVPVALACKPCIAGYFGPGGNATCEACSPGTWSDGNVGSVNGATACQKCSVGKFANVSAAVSNVCQACAAGRYGATEGLVADSACTACPEGTWSSAEGANSSSTCQSCFAGKFSAGIAMVDASACTDCSAGTWSAEIGAKAALSCNGCAASTWSAALGAVNETTCIACAVGKASAAGAPSAESCVVVEAPPAPVLGITSTAAAESTSSLPAWAVALMVVGGLALIGAVVAGAMMGSGDKKKKKKSNNEKKAAPQEAPAPSAPAASLMHEFAVTTHTPGQFQGQPQAFAASIGPVHAPVVQTTTTVPVPVYQQVMPGMQVAPVNSVSVPVFTHAQPAYAHPTQPSYAQIIQ